MHTLVLLRHGLSVWNKENRFTGWTDIDLSPEGVKEAERAADLLRNDGYTFDSAYTSVLKRAIRTLWIVLDRLDIMWIPVRRHWSLNERHYGALQGMEKVETAAKLGEEQVKIWRRSYDTPPPPLTPEDERYPGHDRRYVHLSKRELPLSEALKQTYERVVPYWDDVVVPDIRAGRRVIIAAHGNSLRALVKHLDHLSEEEVLELNIPTGIPLVYELGADMRPRRHFYLGDPDAAKKAAAAVAAQAGHRR